MQAMVGWLDKQSGIKNFLMKQQENGTPNDQYGIYDIRIRVMPGRFIILGGKEVELTLVSLID